MAFVFVNIRGLMQHDKRCNWLVGNHHLLHHTYYVCNYGQYWIDFVLRTTHQDKKRQDKKRQDKKRQDKKRE
jgi:sterol desaturase/sphingolipid hydroxylase (fatty acid hydroxylase superfamily)